MNVVLLQNFPLKSYKALSTYFYNIAQSISKRKEINLYVISSDNCEENDKNEDQFTRFTTSTNPYSTVDNLYFTIKAGKILKKINNNIKIDVIHSLYPLSSLAAVEKANLFKKTKNIYDIRSPWLQIGATRGSIPKKISSIYVAIAESFEKYLIRKTDGLIFITEALKDYYAERYKLISKKNYKIVPSGFNDKLFQLQNKNKFDIHKKYNLSQDSIILGYIGSLEKSRQLNYLVKFFADALVLFPNMVLVFVGDGGGKKEILNEILSHHIVDKVKLVDPVPHEQVSEFILNFDICISHIPNCEIYRPSFPLKTIEYASLGKPILATNILPHQKFKEEYKKIELYSDSSSFISSLTKLISNAQFKEKSFEKIINKYTWDNISKHIIDFYFELISKKNN